MCCVQVECKRAEPKGTKVNEIDCAAADMRAKIVSQMLYGACGAIPDMLHVDTGAGDKSNYSHSLFRYILFALFCLPNNLSTVSF